MPLISDPGNGLVAAAAAAGHQVIPIAGPSAFLLALVASGLSSSRFTFVGFLPEKAKARKFELQKLAGDKAPICLLCSVPLVQTGPGAVQCDAMHMYTTAAVWMCVHTAGLQHTLVVYVPPHDLLTVLQDAAQVLGEGRQCVVARELTKVVLVHQDLHRTHLQHIRLHIPLSHERY